MDAKNKTDVCDRDVEHICLLSMFIRMSLKLLRGHTQTKVVNAFGCYVMHINIYSYCQFEDFYRKFKITKQKTKQNKTEFHILNPHTKKGDI